MRVRDGDHLAFRRLFDMFYPEMVKAAYMLLKESDLAKEAAQDAFVAVWRNHSTLDPNKSVRAYIKRATISRSLNLIKSRNHHRDAGEEPLMYETDHHTPFEDLSQKEMAAQIKDAVDSLPDRCRQVFILAKYDGKSHKEIGQIMDISPKTVENQVARAMKLLRGLLASYYKTMIIFLLLIRDTLNWPV